MVDLGTVCVPNAEGAGGAPPDTCRSCTASLLAHGGEPPAVFLEPERGDRAAGPVPSLLDAAAGGAHMHRCPRAPRHMALCCGQKRAGEEARTCFLDMKGQISVPCSTAFTPLPNRCRAEAFYSKLRREQEERLFHIARHFMLR
jgi:hypothetical protein